MSCRPFNPKAAGGNVERWLLDCEAQMRDSLKDVLKHASDAYVQVGWLEVDCGMGVAALG